MTLEWHGEAVAAAVRSQAEKGLFLAAEHVLNASNRIVPHETGALERSGIAQAEGDHAVVSYNTVYAARQHEEVGWAHSEGRQAKYLESALNSNKETANMLVAAAVRRALGG